MLWSKASSCIIKYVFNLKILNLYSCSVFVTTELCNTDSFTVRNVVNNAAWIWLTKCTKWLDRTLSTYLNKLTIVNFYHMMLGM